MKRQFIYLVLVLFCCSCSKKEKLIVGSFDWNQIAIIDKKSSDIEWTYDLPAGEACYDVEITPGKEILYAYKQGAKLIKRRNLETVWDYKANEKEELYTATRLESGNYLLGICGFPARIVELDKNGEVVKEVTFNTATPDKSMQFRHIIKTPQETYLIPILGKNKVSEISAEGRFLKSVLCYGTPNSVKLADDGKWVVSCGRSQRFVEIDPETKQTTRSVETANLTWGTLLYVAELVRYKNGNTLLANYNDAEDNPQPFLIEIDPDNNIAWRLAYKPQIKNISTVYSFFE
ncbi:MAG: hypothetical protein LBH90_03395 [Tannerella sp.]|nr:hypothetical protein [Tannerella sp.]